MILQFGSEEWIKSFLESRKIKTIKQWSPKLQSFFPRGVLDEILNLIGSVSEGFPSYSFIQPYLIPNSDFLNLSLFMQTSICWVILIDSVFIVHNKIEAVHK